jgi:hypothetical protein
MGFRSTTPEALQRERRAQARIHDIRGYFEFIDLRRMTHDVEPAQTRACHSRAFEAERAVEKIAQEELARIVRNHAASRTSKQ